MGRPRRPNAELGGYSNFTSGGVRVAGLMRNDGGQGAPDFWTTYLAVPDAAATVEAATAAGGQVHVAGHAGRRPRA